MFFHEIMFSIIKKNFLSAHNLFWMTYNIYIWIWVSRFCIRSKVCMHHLSSVYLSCHAESSIITIVFSAEKQSQMGKLRATKILLRLHKQFHSFFFSLSLALFFFSFSFLFARELLVPKGLDTTTIMELTKWSLILVVVMVVFLSNVAKFGHHH